MGQILSNPVIDKEHHTGSDAVTAFGLCAMQGWRMSMEDSHIVELNANCYHSDTKNTENDHIALYSIFDGHGGAGVAQFAGEKLVSILQEQESFQNGELAKALVDTYLACDEKLLVDPILKNDHSGCTATSILLSKKQQKLVCGNSGDSRTVLSINGFAKSLSFDHKPTLVSEKSRIMAAGGFVEMDRVNGNLALSRALGDFEFKSNDTLTAEEQVVTCVPDIVEHSIDFDNDEFIVLACDGIWDCLTSQECIDLIHYGINKGDMTLNDICSRLIDVCCSPTTEGTGIGCDNMSVTIVAILREGETIEQWFTRIRDKKHNKPISFELKRKVIYSYFDFKDDGSIFDVTTKKPENKFNGVTSRNETYDIKSEIENDDEMDMDGKKGNMYPIEAFLGSGGVQLTTGADNNTYITGNLTDMLNSFRKVAAEGNIEIIKDTDDDDGENIEVNDEDIAEKDADMVDGDTDKDTEGKD